MAPPLGPVTVISVDQPDGFFDVLDRHFADVRPKSLTPLHRICSQARRHGVKSVVVEEISEAAELEEENSALLVIGRACQRHKVRRITFFRRALRTDDLSLANPEDFIGYVIWKDDFGAETRAHFSRVYESTIEPPAANYVHFKGLPVRSCRVGHAIFTVRGQPFFQQNGVTNSCAHASLRTVAACFHAPDYDATFGEITQMAGLPATTNFASDEVGGGLLVAQILQVAKKLGASCVSASYQPPRDPDDGTTFLPPELLPPFPYQRLVYGCIESGYPAIIVFGEDERIPQSDPDQAPLVTWNGDGIQMYRHAITVFGHTFNRDMWLPRIEEARFDLGETLGHIPSDYWTGSFIGHDDGLGPYYSIPRHYMRSMPTVGT